MMSVREPKRNRMWIMGMTEAVFYGKVTNLNSNSNEPLLHDLKQKVKIIEVYNVSISIL